jgi:diphosphomevalonate decarboxylase
MSSATARAHANIALVKYWAKRDAELNLPAAGSLSVTLSGMSSVTNVTFGDSEDDQLWVDGKHIEGSAADKALAVVNRIRKRAGLTNEPVRIESRNDFPTGAGLASSASGMAALTVAAAGAAELKLSRTELSNLARLGSGSACRSVFGGYVEWQPGTQPDGSDSHAHQLHPPEHWDLRVVVAIVQDRPKAVDSSAGMAHTAETSPYLPTFIELVAPDLVEAKQAVWDQNLERLARVAERSCLRMHAAMIAADPPLLYLTPESWQVIDAARQMRARGVPVFFTADAGPNVKLFCEPEALGQVQGTVEALGCVKHTILARPGPGAELIDA